MFQINQFVVIVGLIILLGIIFIHYRVYPSRLFFDDGKAMAPVDQQAFFNYDTNKKFLRKNHAI